LSQQLQHQPEKPQELEVDAAGGENMEEATAPDHIVSCYVAPARLELPDYYQELPETPTTARDYSLAIDYTTSKTVGAVISKCKDFIALGSQSTKDCVALLNSLETLLDILEKVQVLHDLISRLFHCNLLHIPDQFCTINLNVKSFFCMS